MCNTRPSEKRWSAVFASFSFGGAGRTIAEPMMIAMVSTAHPPRTFLARSISYCWTEAGRVSVKKDLNTKGFPNWRKLCRFWQGPKLKEADRDGPDRQIPNSAAKQANARELPSAQNQA